jgi:hypothetical protein
LGMPAQTQPPAQAHGSQLVHDLRVTRKGNRVMLTWSQPPTLPSSVAKAKICRSLASASEPSTGGSLAACAQPIGEVDPSQSSSASAAHGKGTLQFVDQVPRDLEISDPPQFAVYRIELLDAHGGVAGYSNSVSVPWLPAAWAKALHFELDVRGVYLIWENEIEKPASVQMDYRVLRSEKGSAKRTPIPFLRGVVYMSEGERWSAIDPSIVWEKTYTYTVTSVTKVYSPSGKLIGEVEGADSDPIEVVAHDVFPPAVPEHLIVMASEIPAKKFADLIWAPNTEKDLAAYNVYRREQGTRLEKVGSSPSTVISFHDTGVLSGHKYFYSISAVDRNGNESAKSQETTEVIID